MFVDETTLECRAGRGGDGTVSWRREKYIPRGGPWGGDGGRGGDIVLVAVDDVHTLSDFRHKKIIQAQNGERGGTNRKHGRDGAALILKVPTGTIVRDWETDEMLADLNAKNMQFTLCRGGRGGYGNAHFVSSTRQAPKFAELGDEGDVKHIILELRLVADIAIVGFPNAGKSTLIATVTNVRPKIADYPFTTLVPNLGVMEWKGESLVLEDVPGLIEGASAGRGLGIDFLKHIERARMILHIVDASTKDIVKQYRTLRRELEQFSEYLAKKPEIIAISKTDTIEASDLQTKRKSLESEARMPVLAFSSFDRVSVDRLQDALIEAFAQAKPAEKSRLEISSDTHRVYDLKQIETISVHARPKITRQDETTLVLSHPRIEQIVRMTDTRNPDALSRVYDVLEKHRIPERILRELWVEWEEIFEAMEDIKLIIAEKQLPIRPLLLRARLR